jgi:hypothetical protein
MDTATSPSVCLSVFSAKVSAENFTCPAPETYTKNFRADFTRPSRSIIIFVSTPPSTKEDTSTAAGAEDPHNSF